MSWPISHLYIANRIMDKIGIKKYSQYYLGTIVPNAVEVIERDSHLNMKIDKNNKDLYFEIWKSNIKDFFYKNKTIHNFDFLIGYCIHLFSDIYFRKNITDVYIQYYKNNKNEFKDNFSKIFENENVKIDYEIYFSNNYFKEDIFPKINNSIRFNFKNIVLRNEMNKLIKWYNLRYSNFEFNKKPNANKHISYDQIMENNKRTIDFIQEEFLNEIMIE